jgi:hypothetical protein
MDPSDDRHLSRSVLRDNKEQVAKDEELLPGEEKISYGKRFSQTEEMYQVRQMNHELEELAKRDGMLEEPKAPSKQPQRERAAIKEATVVTGAMPIGALPADEEPPPRAKLSEALDDAQRYLEMIRGAVRDIATASVRLARLPVEVAAMAAHKLRPLKA